MKLPVPVALLLTLGAITCACGESANSDAIPRPRAYPRLQLPDTAMTPVADAPLHFVANAEAITSIPRPGWTDISYPNLGAEIHVSFTEVDSTEIPAVMDNRMERLLLNSGSREPRFDEFINEAGFDCLLARTDGISTPLQFLATDHRCYVVSGAVYFPEYAEATDSLRPATEAIQTDILRALQALH